MFAVGRPLASTGTIDEYWLVQMTATTFAGDTGLERSACVQADFVALQTASGSCSTAPPVSCNVSTVLRPVASNSPCSDTIAALGPLVPRSIASTQGDAVVTARTPARQRPVRCSDTA